MKKDELIQRLVFNHEKFLSYLATLNNEEFVYSLNNEKWSAGQHAEHILRALSPLRMIFGLPKWIGKLTIYKKANRPSKTNEKLIEKYLQRLQLGGKASGRFVPEKVDFDKRATLAKKIEATVRNLCRSLDKFSEEDLDKLVLPHPLLGMVTLREMLYFTIYHVDHHHRLVMRDLVKVQ